MIDRVDIENVVEKMLDVVQFGRGYEVEHAVHDPDGLRALLRAGARARKMRVRTGTSGPVPVTVWVMRADQDLEFTNPPNTDRDRALIDQAFGDLGRRAEDDPRA